MKKSSEIDVYLTQILKMMEKAMPEIKRQVEVYEKNIKMGIQVKNPRISPQFNNV
jgi:hypothetical protein